MRLKKKIPCILIARKNSKEIKNKNRLLIDGKPLIEYSINYLKKSKFVDDIIVSTDDNKIAQISKKKKMFYDFS